ncbi:MAG: hypothetical protein AABZ74_10430 [Cyanobacteriota bacterium]
MNKKVYMSMLLCSVVLFVSCSNYNTKNDTILTNYNEKNAKVSFSGTVDFSTNNYKNKEFKIKAVENDITSSSGITFSYPSDYLDSTLRNKIITTSVTNENGNFSIAMPTSFNPVIDQVYVLDATKRLNGTGSKNVSLRTLIKYDGYDWKSISSPKIVINSKTTALSILAGYSIVLPESTIGKISFTDGISELPLSITDNTSIPTTNLTFGVMNNANLLVESALSEDSDPLANILLKNEQLFFQKNVNINSSLAGCVADCPKSGKITIVSKNRSLGTEYPAQALDACVGDISFCPKSMNPSVSTNGNKIIVVWQELQDDKTYDIMGRIFNKVESGIAPDILETITPQGNKFKINLNIFGDQTRPDVVMDKNGNFYVTWQGYTDRSFSNIYARKFDVNGTPLGNYDNSVNYTRQGINSKPRIAINETEDNFVITWQSNRGGISGYDVFFSKLDNLLNRILTEDQIANTTLEKDQINPVVSFTYDNHFKIVWEGKGLLDEHGIFGRNFDVNSSSNVNEVQQNTTKAGTIATKPTTSNGFLAWQESSFSNKSSTIYYKKFEQTYPSSFEGYKYDYTIQFEPKIFVTSGGTGTYYHETESFYINNVGNKINPSLCNGNIIWQGKNVSNNLNFITADTSSNQKTVHYRDKSPNNVTNSNLIPFIFVDRPPTLEGIPNLTKTSTDEKGINLYNIKQDFSIDYERQTISELPYLTLSSISFDKINTILEGVVSNMKLGCGNIGNHAMVWENSVNNQTDQTGIYLANYQSYTNKSLKEIKVD